MKKGVHPDNYRPVVFQDNNDSYYYYPLDGCHRRDHHG